MVAAFVTVRNKRIRFVSLETRFSRIQTSLWQDTELFKKHGHSRTKVTVGKAAPTKTVNQIKMFFSGKGGGDARGNIHIMHLGKLRTINGDNCVSLFHFLSQERKKKRPHLPQIQTVVSQYSPDFAFFYEMARE